jgi:hypothetical protein
MFYITITFFQGPTIMEEDRQIVMLKRATGSEQQANKIQAAALLLDAINVIVEKEQKK